MTLKPDDQPQELTAEALVDLENPTDVRLSPSGRQVIYSLRPSGRKEEHPVSSLWIAEVGNEHSARQITSGLFHDTLPQWSPYGNCIAFLSDRAKRGESSAIYLLSMQGGEPYSVTKAENKQKITAFSWSPNGHFIAFLSPDEKSVDQDIKEKERNDAKVYGEHWEFNRLRCLHVPTRELSVLFANEAHINEFTWSDDSTEVAYVVQKTPDIDSSGYYGVSFGKISLTTKKISLICDFPGTVSGLIWYDGQLLFLAGVVPNKSNTSSMIYRICPHNKVWARYGYGVESCAVRLRRTAGSVAVQVQSGLSDQIHLVDHQAEAVANGGLNPRRSLCTCLYRLRSALDLPLGPLACFCRLCGLVSQLPRW